MKKLMMVIIAIFLAAAVSACSPGNSQIQNGTDKAGEVLENSYVKQEGIEVIYLAGGCFWGTEELMQTIPGVVNAISGYANGEEGVTPSYETVSNTGFRETVRVEYDPTKVSLDMILFTYFRSIDPTIEDRQGNDIGTQYQAGIYWGEDSSRDVVLHIADVEKKRFPEFAVEIEPLQSFFDAEEYHQDYLDNTPGGYCHISPKEFELAANMIIDPADYRRPSDDDIKALLTQEQFNVTQEADTEMPFDNEYWDNHEEGIYVDIVTGEPLFSSKDKFDSGTGWPSFTQGIDENVFVYLADYSFGSARIEVRSRAGNSHLGHVFYGEAETPSGVRYCINSAALRFIPYERLDEEGYGYLKSFI